MRTWASTKPPGSCSADLLDSGDGQDPHESHFLIERLKQL